MGKLFIIGNGFDLAHGLKTSYEDFHKYLKDNYPNAKINDYLIPESRTMPDGAEVYKDEEVVGVILNIISEAEDGEMWSDLENTLGYLNFDNYLDDYPEFEDDWEEANNNEDRAIQLAGAIREITDYFSKWINKIKISKEICKKNDFEKLLDKDCFYLNFNYTRTLEILYEVKNVCHIHGQQGEQLLFGHGNEIDYFDEYMESHIGSEGPLTELHHTLKKDTNKAIKDNYSFFNSLPSSIDSIYSYGFSFSKVDEIYIKEICDKLPTKNVVWYLNKFDDSKHEQYMKLIKSCGFQGGFHIYSINS